MLGVAPGRLREQLASAQQPQHLVNRLPPAPQLASDATTAMQQVAVIRCLVCTIGHDELARSRRSSPSPPAAWKAPSRCTPSGRLLTARLGKDDGELPATPAAPTASDNNTDSETAGQYGWESRTRGCPKEWCTTAPSVPGRRRGSALGEPHNEGPQGVDAGLIHAQYCEPPRVDGEAKGVVYAY